MDLAKIQCISTKSIVIALLSFSGIASFDGDVPSSLPSKNFMFGLGNQDKSIQFMNESKLPWDFRYQYVTMGWQQWGKNFVYNFAKENRDNGYSTVLTIYWIVNIGGEYPDPEYATLNNPEKVKQWFDEYRELLRQCDSVAIPLIVTIEPDMYGYMYQKAIQLKTNDAKKLTAAISNSGHPDAVGSNAPNTFAGFNQVMKWMRDKYAPKVLLAPMINKWAAGDDLAGAKKAGEFMNSIGVKWDLFYSEWSDRDAQFKKNWFDSTAFEKVLDFDNRLSEVTKCRILLWQMPCGNMYINPNGTAGRYTDNRSEYIFNHVEYMADHGIIGVLFGSGENTQTKYGNETDPEGGYIKCWAGEYYTGKKGALTPGSSTIGPVPLPVSPNVATIIFAGRNKYPSMTTGFGIFDLLGRRRNIRMDKTGFMHQAKRAGSAGCYLLIEKPDGGARKTPDIY